jgi:hypothetical protein
LISPRKLHCALCTDSFNVEFNYAMVGPGIAAAAVSGSYGNISREAAMNFDVRGFSAKTEIPTRTYGVWSRR